VADKAVGVLALTGLVAFCGEHEKRASERTNKLAVFRKDFVFIAAPVKGRSKSTQTLNIGQYNSNSLARQ
jgi:hypothetical protein